MDKEKLLKQISIKNIRINNCNMSIQNKNLNQDNMYQFKDFAGRDNFNANIKVTHVTDKDTLHTILSKSDAAKQFCEWITDDMKIKPFFDVDLELSKSMDYMKHAPVYQEMYLKQFQRLFPDGDIAIAQAHGPKKNINAISFHYVVNGYETTIKEMREFNKINELYLEGPGRQHVDKAVYRTAGNMRSLHSEKPGQGRPFLPVTHEDDVLKHCIQSGEWTNTKEPKKINMVANISPPASPPSSVGDSDDDDEGDDDDEFTFTSSDSEEFQYQHIQTCDLNELDKIMKSISNEKFNSDYDTWVKVGMALCNVTGGASNGRQYYIEFSKSYKDYNVDELMAKWNNFIVSSDSVENKLGMGFLRGLYRQVKSKDKKYTTLKDIFEDNIDQGFDKAKESMLHEMNKRIIYVKETGEFIHQSSKFTIKDDGSKIEVPCWYLKKKMTTADDFIKENFTYFSEVPSANGKGAKSVETEIKPFTLWMGWQYRKEVRAIDFDPTDKDNPDIFNIWKGYDISKDMADLNDVDDAQPILDHILTCWCKGDAKQYDYVCNYLAHIIQKPWKKTGVVLCLKSSQGGGKGIILSKLNEIIGQSHYCQNSNASYLFGDFNGQLEGKIVVNLDEAFWGGDKKMEGMMKNKITEKNQTINKKNKEAYDISDYANYIITTNNDWFAGTTADDRRYFCLDLKNHTFSGRSAESQEYFKPIITAPTGAFAKFLYNRDLTNFSPRIFEKTALLQGQVERNWNPVQSWWHNVLKNGGWDTEIHGQTTFVGWNELNEDEANYISGVTKTSKKTGEKAVLYFKDYIYKNYLSNVNEKRGFKDNSAFFRELKANCLASLFNEVRPAAKGGVRPSYLIFPSLDEARAKWNEIQEYEYNWENDDDEWE